MNQFAKLPELMRRFGIELNHVVHVGAHKGEEMPFYAEAGIPYTTLVEPIPELAEALRERFPVANVIWCACAARTGEAELFIMARTNMSTIQPPTLKDRVARSLVVPLVTLDEALRRTVQEHWPAPDYLVVDAQGAELGVLMGAPLDQFKMVTVEVCTVNDRTMASPYHEVYDYMRRRNFRRIEEWHRDYGFVHKWARGKKTHVKGNVIDVTFVKDL